MGSFERSQRAAILNEAPFGEKTIFIKPTNRLPNPPPTGCLSDLHVSVPLCCQTHRQPFALWTLFFQSSPGRHAVDQQLLHRARRSVVLASCRIMTCGGAPKLFSKRQVYCGIHVFKLTQYHRPRFSSLPHVCPARQTFGRVGPNDEAGGRRKGDWGGLTPQAAKHAYSLIPLRNLFDSQLEGNICG